MTKAPRSYPDNSELRQVLEQARDFIDPDRDPPRINNRKLVMKINAVLSRVDAQGAGDCGTWQPIETAPKDIEVLMGWWSTWPERFWETAAGLAGSTKGGWLHGQATHWMPCPSPPVSSTHVCTLEEAATRLCNELTGQNIQREMFSIGIGANELHVYIQLPRVNCRADRIGGWNVVWHFNVGPAVAFASPAREDQP